MELMDNSIYNLIIYYLPFIQLFDYLRAFRSNVC